jgi:hypothetical protein
MYYIQYSVLSVLSVLNQYQYQYGLILILNIDKSTELYQKVRSKGVDLQRDYVSTFLIRSCRSNADQKKMRKILSIQIGSKEPYIYMS